MKLFDNELLDGLVAQAKSSPRLRANHNVHDELDDPVQRLFIAIEPQSYVRPHLHPESFKSELFMLVRGRAVVLTFDERGSVLQRMEMAEGSPLSGLEIPPNTWHTLYSLESGTVVFEVKQGPYIPLTDKSFAQWAPNEGDAQRAMFCDWLSDAQPGDVPPAF